MKTVLSIFLLWLSTSTLFAQGSFTAHGSTVRYILPDSTKWFVVRDGMDPETHKYFLMFKHVPVEDDQGRKIEPVIAVICEAVPDSANLIVYSAMKRLQVPFSVNKVLTVQDGHFVYDNAIGYDGEYQKNGITHKILIAHMLHDITGVQIICDSTDGVYDQVESEMRAFVRSVTMK